MSFLEALNWRYATKRMNGHTVPQEKLDTILEAARLAPSSYGLQPYSVAVVSDAALRNKIRGLAVPQPQVTEGSHLLVFATWTTIDEASVERFIEHVASERDLPLSSLAGYTDAIKSTLRKYPTQVEREHWASKQAYIALGMALAAAATEHVDATPMEGFSPEALDELLDLKAQGLRSVVVMAIGERDESNDSMTSLKKVRWPKESFITHT
ncbi:MULTISPECIES: nitroreductase family protein [Chromohalobacter]|uniref:Nitroreductase n=1 Tax=Chromohalobacter marismortui TaxID=42055 RepID=A0A4R7NSW8_9GAMM|nr:MULTISPECIES: nitroreductase family protein [Chromohalobacter]MCI0509072.1 nitroreductase family protein [Chromohalobacter sp.]MCI0592823.1 nitroreductase family protein [Chromohalobacter sp.]MCK0745387.1 nitroreductase family protein [Chromohalobacter nigrandesensis]TDU24037.1 nitroreductase [Chromohalobacter marismortui]